MRLLSKLNEMSTNMQSYGEQLSEMHGHGVLHGFKRKLLACGVNFLSLCTRPDVFPIALASKGSEEHPGQA